MLMSSTGAQEVGPVSRKCLEEVSPGIRCTSSAAAAAAVVSTSASSWSTKRARVRILDEVDTPKSRRYTKDKSPSNLRL
ncbi:hypothetical protein RRG08_056104 [Elysia crispata]|uniref:Uncharacterized protein n=1 Tax=Elysia crispata TaxID=231223 RepID=A0AAE0ZBX2_9GAST|nr:hypothetical protein RRG08_056104 [Elysia crispata]